MKQEVSGSTPVKARVPFLFRKGFVFVFCLYGCPYSFSIGKEISPACATSIAFPCRFGPLSKSAIIIISIISIVVVVIVIIVVVIIIVIIIVVIITLAQSQVE